MTLKTINFRNRININSGQEREVKIMIILLSIFMSGIIFGIGFTANNSENLINYFDKFIFEDNSFSSVFFNSVLINSLFLIIIFISGFSSIGIPAVILTIVLKGVTIGIFSAILVCQYTLSGIGIYLLSYFPTNIIYAVTLLLSSDYSIIQSMDILSLIYENSFNEKIQIRKFVYKNIVLIFLILIASISDGLLMILFGNLYIV